MSLLIDTHVLLWWFLDSSKLRKKTRDLLADLGTPVYVSAASTWEISIKSALGRLILPGTPSYYLPDRILRAGLSRLPITMEHTYGVESLPLHHADPFDRLLIAQAQCEGFAIVTSDRVFSKYDVHCIQA